jgi:hypothetical protein
MADLIFRPLIEITRALREKRLTAQELVEVAIATPGSHGPVGKHTPTRTGECHQLHKVPPCGTLAAREG